LVCKVHEPAETDFAPFETGLLSL